MRYLTARFVYTIHVTLRRAYTRLGQGQTFNPQFPLDEIFARLDGAVSRPQLGFGGEAAHPTLFHKVAALGLGIAQGHVFGNGNKRTALSAMIYALVVNGWQFTMPPSIASLMMLRVASAGGMTLDQAATLIGAWSYLGDEERNAAILASVQQLIDDGDVVIESPDQFPAEPPDVEKSEYIERAKVIVQEQMGLLNDDERATFRQSFSWPAKMMGAVATWTHVQFHAGELQRKRRRRHKAVGKRRRPHCGGRTIAKVCRPITDSKLGINRSAEAAAERSREA